MLLLNVALGYFDIFFEAIALIMSLVYRRYLRKRSMRFLPVTIAVILAIDFAGAVNGTSPFAPNYLRLLVQIGFYGDFFLHSMPLSRFRSILTMITVAFALFFSIAMLTSNGNEMIFFSRTLFLYGIFITAWSLFLLYKKFTAANSRYPADPEAWICFGVVVFFSGFSFTVSLYPLMFEYSKVAACEPVFELITRSLSAMLFASTSYAIYLTKRFYDLTYA
jgi:hypothetical protein